MIVVNDDYRLLHKGKIREGGLSRNEAIIKWLKSNKKVLEVQLDNNRVYNALTTFKILLSSKNETILFFYPTVGIPVLKNGLIGALSAKLFLMFVKKSCERNNILIDISDLKYEQAIDLKIDNERLKAIEKMERRLFALNCNFIFASQSMKAYAEKKYRIDERKCRVLDNGGNLQFQRIEMPDVKDRTRLVYAGTLNKGRCIEKMIESVTGNESVVLYLCGTGGEWIEDRNNIINLGALSEEEAHYVVSCCDIGLIPYDETRFYYNIAYPTKLAFYITAGIPFISTDVNEVRKIHDNYKIGYVEKIEDWVNLINLLDEKDIESQKERIKKIKFDFTWEYKCEHSFLATI